jgi:four helix bundle protein
MARSQADFVSKIGIACEEADECAYWLELLVETDLASSEKVASLIREANEFVAIFAASRKTAKAHIYAAIDNRH